MTKKQHRAKRAQWVKALAELRCVRYIEHDGTMRAVEYKTAELAAQAAKNADAEIYKSANVIVVGLGT